MSDNLAARLRAELEEMANVALVNMELWNRFSNRVLTVSDALEAQAKKIDAFVEMFDKMVGTPCEQVRHGHEVEELRARIAKLEAALKPFEEELRNQELEVPQVIDGESLIHSYGLRLRDLRAARAALKGESDD